MARDPNNQIRQVFDNIRKRSLNKAQREITRALPGAIQQLRDFIDLVMMDFNLGHMTGNTINSCGVGLYRDGEFIACATTDDIEGKGGPIHVTLKSGDVYPAGSPRYDGSVQQKTFVAHEGEHNFMANEKVVSFLRHYPPTRKKDSLAYRFAMYLEYNQIVGQRAMLMMADDIEKRGGKITEYHLDADNNWKKYIRTR